MSATTSLPVLVVSPPPPRLKRVGLLVRQPAIGSPLASLVVLDGKLVEVLNNEALVMVDALDHLDELLQLRGGGLAGGR